MISARTFKLRRKSKSIILLICLILLCHLLIAGVDLQNASYKTSSVMLEPEVDETMAQIDHNKLRYPYCIVWTPIPLLSWLFPIIGHMGIATSTGVIRDFAGPYFVSEDNMAFGNPAKYWQLSAENIPINTPGSSPFHVWDAAVADASEEYKHRMHNLCCDNCHSHVAMALNLMKYKNSSSWNMIKLALLMLVHGKYVSFLAILKTWLPFLIIAGLVLTVASLI